MQCRGLSLQFVQAVLCDVANRDDADHLTSRRDEHGCEIAQKDNVEIQLPPRPSGGVTPRFDASQHERGQASLRSLHRMIASTHAIATNTAFASANPER
jgi:hypothetical protein